MISLQTRSPMVTTDEWRRNLRRSPRLKTDFELQIRYNIHGEQVLIAGYARNISGEGMGALIPANLEVDQTIEMQFTLPHSDRQLNLRGVIRAYDDSVYGIEFLDVAPATRRVLRAFALR